MPATMTQQHNLNRRGKLGVTSVKYYSELNAVPKSQNLYTENQPSVSITDWLTPRLLVPPTGQPTPQNNTPAPSLRHTRHYIYNVHTNAHLTPNTYTIHTIYAQLSNHGIASHTQYTLYNVHAQQ